MKTNKFFAIVIFCLLPAAIVAAQDSTGSFSEEIPAKHISSIGARAAKIDEALSKKSLQLLSRLDKLEASLVKKAGNTDSLKKLLTAPVNKIAGLQKGIEAKTTTLAKSLTGSYSPVMDTLKTALKFLSQAPAVATLKEPSEKLQTALSQLNGLETRIKQAGDLELLLKERVRQLKQLAEKLGSTKQLNKFRKEFYYYQESLKQIKETINNPEVWGKKLLPFLQKLPVFKTFMAENSELASLFGGNRGAGNNPVNALGGGLAGNLAGLQTRGQLMQTISQRAGAANPQALQQLLTTQLQSAASQINQIREKLQAGVAIPELPNFKPNTERIKPFAKRLIYGFNMAGGPANKYLPAYVDMALTIQYKLNATTQMGIAGSYRLGLGNSWRQIKLTNQSVGIRTWLEVKAGKTNWWLAGGAETNYMTGFKNIAALKNTNAWQKSALLGISKTYSAGKKLNGKIYLLYDFLYQQHNPQTQPLVFRYGYTFK
jgi:hypothetical protein